MREGAQENFDLPMIPFLKKFLLLLIVVIFGYYFLLPSNLGFDALFPDSDQYNQFASEISGVEWRRLSRDEVPSGRLNRTIGYPFLLSMGFIAASGDLFTAHYITHFVLWVLLIVGALICLSFSQSIIFIPILCAITFLLRPYFTLLMTEWTVFILFSLTGIFYLWFSKYQTAQRIILVSLTLGALAAVRLEFVITIPVLQYFIWHQDRRSRIVSLVASSILPLLALGFNFLDQGRLSIRELPKAGLFYLTTGLIEDKTSVDLEENNAEGEKFVSELVEILKTKGERFTTQDFVRYALLDPSGIFAVGQHNDALVEEYKTKAGFGHLEKYKLEGEIANVIISNNLSGYLFLVLAGSVCVALSIVILLFLRPSQKRQTYLWQAVWLLGVAHIVRLAFISAVNVQYPRYYAPTLAVVLLFALFFQVTSMTDEVGKSEKS